MSADKFKHVILHRMHRVGVAVLVISLPLALLFSFPAERGSVNFEGPLPLKKTVTFLLSGL